MSASDREKQLAEVELLSAVFCQAGEFSPPEESLAPSEPLRCSVHLQLGEDDAAALISIECTLPFDYPSRAPPALYLRSSSSLFDLECSRRCNDLLSAQVTLMHADAGGDGVLLAAMQWLQEQMGAWLRDSQQRQSQRPSAAAAAQAASSSAASSSDAAFQRVFILFHHIYSRLKRRTLLAAARELELTGVCKSGKPGVVIIEGPETRVHEWIAQIKSLSWQRMSVRISQLYPSGSPAAVAKFVGFTMLSPSAGAKWPTMTQLSALCAPLQLQDALRETIGLAGEAGGGEDDGGSGSDDDDDERPAGAAAASAPVPRKLDKRSAKEEEKRLALQLQQSAKVSAAAASTASTTTSDLPCVEVVPIATFASSSSKSVPLPVTQNVKLHVQVKPNAPASEFISLGTGGDAVHLALAAPPRDGAANAAVVRLVADLLGLPAASVSLIGGAKERHKTLLLTGESSAGAICAKLRALAEA